MTKTFPNGLTFESSAQDPNSIATIFQNVTAQILGFPTVDGNNIILPPGSAAWNAVRVGWVLDGQPAWQITEDVCTITATTNDDPFTQTMDELYSGNDDVSIVQQLAYTQVWNVHFSLYGPNCFVNGAFIVSAMSLAWVHDFLQKYGIYAVPLWKRPVYVPENFEGKWWKRADVELRFNELVNLSMIVPLATSAEVVLVKENNLTEIVNNNI